MHVNLVDLGQPNRYQISSTRFDGYELINNTPNNSATCGHVRTLQQRSNSKNQEEVGPHREIVSTDRARHGSIVAVQSFFSESDSTDISR